MVADPQMKLAVWAVLAWVTMCYVLIDDRWKKKKDK